MRRGHRTGTLLLLTGAIAMTTATAGQLAAFGDTGPGSGFAAFSLSANAPGAQFVEDNDNAQTHPEGESDLPEALATLSNGPVGYALASAAWPGATLGNLGTLLIVASGGQVPDQASVLNDPVRAEAKNGQGTVTNTSVPGARMSATALGIAASARSSLDGATSARVYSVGATDASSSTRLTGPRAAVATATTTLHDVSLAGGVVRIASLVSTATATSDGVHASGRSSTVVSGMSVGGVPVSVDAHGVHAGPVNAPLPAQATQAVQQALAHAGITIAFSGPTLTRGGGAVDDSAGTLVVIWKPPPGPGQPDTHETITVLLGGTTVSAHATRGTPYLSPLSAVVGSRPLRQQGMPAGGPRGASVPAVGSSGAGAAAPRVAPLATKPVSASGPTLPGPLSVAWVLLGVVGALAFGLGVLRRLPTTTAAAARCPRESAA